MFWKGKVSVLTHLDAYFKQSQISLATNLAAPELPITQTVYNCKIVVGSVNDSQGIAQLLNEWFEKGKVQTKVTKEWVRSTFLKNAAIWIVARDSKGTVRACISSFRISSPYNEPLVGDCQCGQISPWGIVDWFCVHPLWRGKGIASNLLETLDYITYTIGRKAHVFLKEGTPLPQMPVYATVLKYRKCGSSKIKQMREGTGLLIHDYHCVEKESGIPMIRVEGHHGKEDLKDWEKTLDKELPVCWVFVSGSTIVDMARGWKPDSLVSMYAFRWIPGKWLFKKPDQDII